MPAAEQSDQAEACESKDVSDDVSFEPEVFEPTVFEEVPEKVSDDVSTVRSTCKVDHGAHTFSNKSSPTRRVGEDLLNEMNSTSFEQVSSQSIACSSSQSIACSSSQTSFDSIPNSQSKPLPEQLIFKAEHLKLHIVSGIHSRYFSILDSYLTNKQMAQFVEQFFIVKLTPQLTKRMKTFRAILEQISTQTYASKEYTLERVVAILNRLQFDRVLSVLHNDIESSKYFPHH